MQQEMSSQFEKIFDGLSARYHTKLERRRSTKELKIHDIQRRNRSPRSPSCSGRPEDDATTRASPSLTSSRDGTFKFTFLQQLVHFSKTKDLELFTPSENDAKARSDEHRTSKYPRVGTVYDIRPASHCSEWILDRERASFDSL